MYRVIKKTRVAVSIAFGIVALTAITTAAIGTAITAGWISRLQIVPLVLSTGLPMLLFWVLATLIFGRVYCSSVCPLGTLQDVISRTGLFIRTLFQKKRIKESRFNYHYRQPRWIVRILFLAVMILSLIAGSITLTLTLDPFFTFNNIVTGVAIPALTMGAIYTSATAVAASLASLAVVVLFADKGGRALCNTICPVGSALGVLSINPIFRIDVNTDLCIGCNKCIEVCKSSCIDPSSHTIDTSRCVACFNCTAECGNGAITYTCRRFRLRKPMLMEN